MTRDYGTVEHDGTTLTLTQDAYVENYRDRVRYYAAATDAAGNLYRVAWETTQEWDDMDPEDRDDESLACDWADPVEVILTSEASDD